jgi:hypothetical protein
MKELFNRNEKTRKKDSG